MMVIDGTFFFSPPEHSCDFLSTLQTFLRIPSKIFRAMAKPNETLVTLRAVGYVSVSWACEYDG